MPLYFKTILVSFCLLRILLAILIYPLYNSFFSSIDFYLLILNVGIQLLTFLVEESVSTYFLKYFQEKSYTVFGKLKYTCLVGLISRNVFSRNISSECSMMYLRELFTTIL